MPLDPAQAVIRSSDGWVALKFILDQQRLVQVPNTDRGYVFFPKANVWMSWVHPDDVPYIRAQTHTCCGGHQRRDVFRFATQRDVDRWEGREP